MNDAPDPLGPFDGVDHIVLLVNNLNDAAERFERSGYLVGPRNLHPTFGTANRLIVFENSYIELLTIVDSALAHTPEQRLFAERLAVREGHWLTALAPRDMDKTLEGLARRGVKAGPPKTWTRRADTGVKQMDARFTTSFLESAETLGHVFFLCRQHTPEAIYEPAMMEHPNGARRLLQLNMSVADRTQRNTYAAMLGVPSQPDGSVVARFPSLTELRIASAADRSEERSSILVSIRSESPHAASCAENICGIDIQTAHAAPTTP